ncbi:MAG: hypothetical protein RR759_08570, partial [Ruthenibacterium sp.]
QMSLGEAANTKVQLETKSFTTKTGFVTPTTDTPDAEDIIKPNNGKLTLKIAAAINTAEIYDKAATVPQFNLAYTLQPVDENGKYVTAANAYVGNDAAEAGYKA